MAVDGKRKTRRGKRGGESKRHDKDADVEQPQQQQAVDGAESAALAASDGGYVPPPMEANDSLFYFDNGPQTESHEEEMEKISPASYGLVNPDLQHYLKSCENMLDSPAFETAEDQDIFVNNVYAEAKNFELQLTTDHECSRVLEKLFQISRDYHIRKFFSITRQDTIRLVVHRFSSHTIQTLLMLSAIALEREVRGETSDYSDIAGDTDDGEAQKVRTPLPMFEELVLELAKTLIPQWSFLMSNEYAPHIIRVLLLVLSGDPIEDPTKPKSSIKSKRSAKYMEDANGTPIQHKALSRKRAVPESFGPALDELLRTTGDAMSDVVARGFANHTAGSPVLQLMISLGAERGSTEYPGSLLDKALMGLVSDDGEKENPRREAFFKSMMEDVVGSHFLETVMKAASPKLLQKIYTRYFRTNLKKLAFHPLSNFVVQSLFSNAKDEAQLKTMIEEVAPLFGNLLFENRPGVVRALIDSCVRLQAGYTEVFNALYSGLGATAAAERKELINLLAFLIKYQDFVRADYNRLQFKVQGSLIIQTILQFPGEGMEPILESYFSQAPDKIYTWAKDPSGSRIVEAIVKSPQVPATSKRRLLQQYAGHYADLAVDKYGSHIVDACWEAADIPFKESIVRELIQRQTQVQDSQFGRFALRNCRVEQYKRRADEWRERERGMERKKSMFKDILGKKLGTTPVSAPKPAPASLGAAKNEKSESAKPQEKDEIDSLFSSKKRAASNAAASETGGSSDEDVQATASLSTKSKKRDKDLDDILSAITDTKKSKKAKKAKKAKRAKKDDSDDERGSKKSKKAKELDRKKRRIFSG